MAPKKHHRFGGSKIDSWISCPGSASVEDCDDSNEYADRGSAIHYVAEQCLANEGQFVEDFLDEPIDVDGRAVIFTREMADSARFYINYVRDLLVEYAEKNPIYEIEKQVGLGHYGTLYDGIFSTADFVIDDVLGDLVVVDLKAGKGIAVPAETLQIKYYAAMAADGLLLTYNRIRCIIVQPSDPYGEQIKEIVYTPEEIEQWIVTEVLPAIDSARSDDPSYIPTEKGCRWCPARGKCEAQSKMAFAIAAQEFDMFMGVDLDDPVSAKTVARISSKESTPVDTLAETLKWIPFLEGWIKDIRAEAEKLMLSGTDIPGQKLVESNKHTTWKPGMDPKEELHKGLKFRLKDLYTTKLKSPNAMMKLANENKFSKQRIEKLQALFYKPPGAPTVVPVSDKRPAIGRMDKAEEEFAELLK